MQLNSILFYSVILLFFACDDTMKKVTEPASEKENIQNTDSVSPQKQEVFTIEKIAEMAKNGTLYEEFPNSEIKTQIASINEGMDTVKVIWLHSESKDEVRIDFRPSDSTKVFRVTVEGKENKYYSETGVKPGMTVAALNSINRKPIDFYGFGWDFGGAVKFNNGQLDTSKLRVYLKTDKKIGSQFMGDTPHTFEEAKAAKLELFVNKIIFEPSKSTQF